MFELYRHDKIFKIFEPTMYVNVDTCDFRFKYTDSVVFGVFIFNMFSKCNVVLPIIKNIKN